jgi:hypothetical protein
MLLMLLSLQRPAEAQGEWPCSTLREQGSFRTQNCATRLPGGVPEGCPAVQLLQCQVLQSGWAGTRSGTGVLGLRYNLHVLCESRPRRCVALLGCATLHRDLSCRRTPAFPIPGWPAGGGASNTVKATPSSAGQSERHEAACRPGSTRGRPAPNAHTPSPSPHTTQYLAASSHGYPREVRRAERHTLAARVGDAASCGAFCAQSSRPWPAGSRRSRPKWPKLRKTRQVARSGPLVSPRRVPAALQPSLTHRVVPCRPRNTIWGSSRPD